MFDHHLKCHQQSPTIGLLAAIWTLCSQLGQPFDADSSSYVKTLSKLSPGHTKTCLCIIIQIA